jgi:hypothetical protein
MTQTLEKSIEQAKTEFEKTIYAIRLQLQSSRCCKRNHRKKRKRPFFG